MINPFHRRSVRLKGYDYSEPGAYFVTIVTFQRACILGEVVDGEMRLNQLGQIVAQTWDWLSKQFAYVEVDHYIVMPNHFHGVLQIIEIEDDCRGGSRPAPTKIKTLGQLIGAFKTVSAKKINQLRNTPGSNVWQRNYYEHIIRNELELNDITRYIETNAETWALDPEYIQ
jgi:REP element-mobilizing transposase RayT